MPISFDLERIREQHQCKVYLETGMWNPTSDISLRKALKCGFDKVYCVEIREDWVAVANQVFAKEIDSNRLTIIHDDSTKLSQYIVNNSDFQEKTIFFLDAHVDNNNIHNYKRKCPLLEELNAIHQLPRKDNIIMVDDLRIVSQPFPWGETQYGNINFLERIKEKILEINPQYKFSYLDGHVPNDVLMAYVQS